MVTSSYQASLLDAATANALLLAVMIIRVSVTMTQLGKNSFPPGRTHVRNTEIFMTATTIYSN